MNIKTIYEKVSINYFTYIFALICILTGLFKSFVVIYSIVIIHELGHITMALIFNYEIKKIIIYPFGGYTIINYSINEPFIKEFMLFIGGILFQLISIFIVNIFMSNTLYIYKIFMKYNITMIIFNLIPALPLDGSKVLNMILNKLFSFNFSHIITIYISYFVSFILLIFFYKNINFVLILVLILFYTIKEHKNHVFIFNIFLLERYIKKLKFNCNYFIVDRKLKKMKKYKNNIFIVNNKYLGEYDVLKSYYNKC